MAITIGVALTNRLTVARVEGNRLASEVRRYPGDNGDFDLLTGMPAEAICRAISDEIVAAAAGSPIAAAGVGVPGIVRNGVIEESPNLHQLKGFAIQLSLEAALRQRGMNLSLCVGNDADMMAAGLAATRGQLDRLIRVWTLGNGIGYGRYPSNEGVWEGGHMVVSLDPRETFCGCGGMGHLEGIMGHRAMRLRFLDMEPDEVFENAREGDPRCVEFVKLWHRALAAATASSVHMDGPGKFYITGPDAVHLEVATLQSCVQEMVKMSPLLGSSFEVVPSGEEIAIIGAAAAAASRV